MGRETWKLCKDEIKRLQTSDCERGVERWAYLGQSTKTKKYLRWWQDKTLLATLRQTQIRNNWITRHDSFVIEERFWRESWRKDVHEDSDKCYFIGCWRKRICLVIKQREASKASMNTGPAAAARQSTEDDTTTKAVLSDCPTVQEWHIGSQQLGWKRIDW